MGGGGGEVFIPFSWFPIKWLSPHSERERERVKERGECCNCCQSLLSRALKAAAVSQLRSERSLGCMASPPGLGRIWRVAPPPSVYLSLSTAAHSFWVGESEGYEPIMHRNRCMGNWKDYPQHASYDLEGFQVVEVSPQRYSTQISKTTKGLPNNINTRFLTCLLQMLCQPL